MRKKNERPKRIKPNQTKSNKIDRPTEQTTNWPANQGENKQTNRQQGRQTDRQTDRQTNKQTNKRIKQTICQSIKHSETIYYNSIVIKEESHTLFRSAQVKQGLLIQKTTTTRAKQALLEQESRRTNRVTIHHKANANLIKQYKTDQTLENKCGAAQNKIGNATIVAAKAKIIPRRAGGSTCNNL